MSLIKFFTAMSSPDVLDVELNAQLARDMEKGTGELDEGADVTQDNVDVPFGEETELEVEVEVQEYEEDPGPDRQRVLSMSGPEDMESETVQRKYGNEGPEDPSWRKHKKHFFIFSHSGKPIYTRYGHEEKLITFTGLLLALISFVKDQDNEDDLRVVVAGGCRVVFLTRIPLHLSDEPVGHIERQLLYMHDQVIALLTTGFTKIFQNRSTYDLRNLLGGAERFLDNLVSERESPLGQAFGAVQCVRMDHALRISIGTSIQSGKTGDLMFGVLLCGNLLVSMVRPKKFPLQPADVHILCNFVTSNAPSFRATESWTPICLPHFNEKGFLHAYIAFLAPDTCPDLCLVLLSTKIDGFHGCRLARERIGEGLVQSGALSALKSSIQRQEYSIADVGVPGVLHFMFKSLSTLQYTTPTPTGPYVSRVEYKRLVRSYIRAYHRVHGTVDGLSSAVVARPLKVYLNGCDGETVMGWVTPRFELYATFGPLVTKPAAITACNRVLAWVRRHEDSLFVTSSPVWG